MKDHVYNFKYFLTPSAPEMLPGSLTIIDLGSGCVSRAVLRIAHGLATLMALGIQGETHLGNHPIATYWISSTHVTT